MTTGLEGFRRPVIVCYYFAATKPSIRACNAGVSEGGGVHEEFEGEGGETVESKTESREVYDSVFAGEII